jgi:S1-C subfamily serine protease
MRAEDLIVSLDGAPVQRVDDVQALLNADTIGRPVPVTVLRGDRWLELELIPAELPG